MNFFITPVAGIYAGYAKIAGIEGGFYASGSTRAQVIDRLFSAIYQEELLKLSK